MGACAPFIGLKLNFKLHLRRLRPRIAVLRANRYFDVIACWVAFIVSRNMGGRTQRSGRYSDASNKITTHSCSSI